MKNFLLLSIVLFQAAIASLCIAEEKEENIFNLSGTYIQTNNGNREVRIEQNENRITICMADNKECPEKMALDQGEVSCPIKDEIGINKSIKCEERVYVFLPPGYVNFKHTITLQEDGKIILHSDLDGLLGLPEYAFFTNVRDAIFQKK